MSSADREAIPTGARLSRRGISKGRSRLSRRVGLSGAALAAAGAWLLWTGFPAPQEVLQAGVDDPTAALRRLATLESTIEVAGHVVEDIDGDGRSDLVLVGKGGQIRVWRPSAEGAAIPVGSRVLPRPDRSIFAVADVLGTGARQLVVTSVEGTHAYPGVPGGGFDADPVLLSRRARLSMRVGAPRRVDMLQDVNRDGLPDLLVPTAGRVEVWLAEAVPAPESASGGDANADGGEAAVPPRAPKYRRVASVVVDVDNSRQAAATAISDTYESNFTIPRLVIRDANGDGREDLWVERGDLRSFHLQRENGELPPEPDVTLDLRKFRDTTPEADVKLGETFAGSDDARVTIRDLDGDFIPDYVIGHRRKVWVFHGRQGDPQFVEPSNILKVAEDISALMVIEIDGDRLPDLVLLKIQVPGITTLVRGLISEWEISIGAVAYAGTGDRSAFKREPSEKSNLVIRLPSIMSVLRDPSSFVERIEEAAAKFRASVQADFDGARGDDVALVSEDLERIEVWLARGGERETDDEGQLGQVLRDVFFESKERVWTIDRMLGLIAGFGDRRTADLTGDRDPDGATALRNAGEYSRDSLAAGDFDGDGTAELLVGYTRSEDGREIYDVVAVEAR